MIMVGIVLAGGQSSRFGSPKALAQINHVPFYKYSLFALQPIVQKTVLVIHPSLQSEIVTEGTTIILDEPEHQGKGPLAGLNVAMKVANGEWYFVLPVDVPYINNDCIQYITNHINDEVEAVIPIAHGRIQPLIAVYHKSVQEKIELALQQEKLSLKELLAQLKVSYIDIPKNMEHQFININRISDITK